MKQERKDQYGNVLRSGEFVRADDGLYTFQKMKKGNKIVLYGHTLEELRNKEELILHNEAKLKAKTQYKVFTARDIYDIVEQFICQPEEAQYFCYFITDEAYVKVGMSKNVAQRRNTLQGANGNLLHIICTIPCRTCKDAMSLEGALHKLFNEFKLTGEWFDILYRINTLALRERFGAQLTCVT